MTSWKLIHRFKRSAKTGDIASYPDQASRPCNIVPSARARRNESNVQLEEITVVGDDLWMSSGFQSTRECLGDSSIETIILEWPDLVRMDKKKKLEHPPRDEERE